MLIDNELMQALSTGPQSAGELIARLSISQPTLSRRITAMGNAIMRFGNAQLTRYSLVRELAGQRQFAVYRINQQGKAQLLASIAPVQPEGYIVRLMEENMGNAATYHQSLPWWMTDIRPQGFVGRSFVHQWAAILGLPNALNLWRDDHALIALSQHGLDCTGNLMVGDAALNAYLNQVQSQPISAESRLHRYAELATAALAGELVGSSAGGEQPKFNCLVEGINTPYAALVKFSTPQDNAATRRWRDLLIAEHVALSMLNQAGIACAHSELLESDSQTFLETTRFDRCYNANGRLGRLGMVSLGALDDEFAGLSLAWPQVTQVLAQQNIITQTAHQTVAKAHAFGQLIANADMHRGNLSFMHQGELPLEIAPIYDMLPMHYAPRSSGVVPTEVPPINITHAESLPNLRTMLPLAQQFWQAITTDARISQGFQTITRQQIAQLDTLSTKIN
jgi:hypothetical protein